MGIYMMREPNYLWFTANTAGSTVKLTMVGSPTAVTLETSTDGTNWSTYTFWNTITLSSIGSKVYWRNTSTSTTWFSTSASNYYKFVMTWSINWSGDVNYLINKNSTKELGSDCCFEKLFSECTSLKVPPELPATTLTNYCYEYMFDHSWVTTPPVLSCTSLAAGCYSGMFNASSSLAALPRLPATTLAPSCYHGMLAYCSSIKLNSTQTWEYQTPYRIPSEWTWTTASDAMSSMVYWTTWDMSWKPTRWTPTINTTYYTANPIVW